MPTQEVATELEWSDVARNLARAMTARGEWAGCPVPLPGFRLHIEDRSPYKRLEHAIQEDRIHVCTNDDVREDQAIVNQWYSRRRQCEVVVVHEGIGKARRARCLAIPNSHTAMKFKATVETLGASIAWDFEMEVKAIQLLAGHVEGHKLRQYLMTGMFLETSSRSGVTYLFRKLRPTLAIRPDNRGGTRVLCALCLHPIAYYAGTFAGSMTPTDDVIAHLLLMRGDEPLFWRRANQHSPSSPEAAI
jgi:hypothetical protein